MPARCCTCDDNVRRCRRPEGHKGKHRALDTKTGNLIDFGPGAAQNPVLDVVTIDELLPLHELPAAEFGGVTVKFIDHISEPLKDVGVSIADLAAKAKGVSASLAESIDKELWSMVNQVKEDVKLGGKFSPGDTLEDGSVIVTVDSQVLKGDQIKNTVRVRHPNGFESEMEYIIDGDYPPPVTVDYTVTKAVTKALKQPGVKSHASSLNFPPPLVLPMAPKQEYGSEDFMPIIDLGDGIVTADAHRHPAPCTRLYVRGSDYGIIARRHDQSGRKLRYVLVGLGGEILRWTESPPNLACRLFAEDCSLMTSTLTKQILTDNGGSMPTMPTTPAQPAPTKPALGGKRAFSKKREG